MQAPEKKLNSLDSVYVDFSSTRTTQIDCVIRLLNATIERVKVSLLLPRLLFNIEHMFEKLKGTEYEKFIEFVNDFMNIRDELIASQSHPLKEPIVIRMIDFLHSNYELYKLFPTYMNSLSRTSYKLLKAFEMLSDIAQSHLQRTSKNEITKERKLHQMYHENEGIKSTIEELKKKLHSQRVALRWKMAAKEVYMQKFEDDLAYKKWQNNVRIQNEIEKCSRYIRTNQKASVEKQKELEEELEKTRIEYEKATRINLHHEKEARAEKNKLLLQLQGILKKYDHSIGEKMRENLVLQDEFNEAKKEFDDFMVYYHQEEAIYKEIVVKREEEERRQQQRRIVIFMMNRAARKIQKYWRKWRKDQKKKNKKRKSKKK